MITRRFILPHTASDIFSVTFLLITIPLIYWFELWIVLPEFYDFGTFPYIFHCCFGSFIMMNIVGNFTYTVLCNTSVSQVLIPINTAKIKEGWRFCTICESIGPPRSWHCTTCNTCIVKRDHHCIFTACCVGHYNQRYFLMFIFYLFVSTLYSFIYNNYFIWKRIEFEFPITIVKLIFPVAIFIFGFDDSIDQFYLMLYIVTVIGMLFTGVLCLHHFHLVFKGCTSNEGIKKNYIYNLGWKQNIKEVFGDRWFLIWLVPYIPSKLPQNGVFWQISSKCK
jgi:palmitoyltransferase